jgi:hypothetical protein
MTVEEILETIQTLSLKELCAIFKITSEILVSRVEELDAD